MDYKRRLLEQYWPDKDEQSYGKLSINNKNKM